MDQWSVFWFAWSALHLQEAQSHRFSRSIISRKIKIIFAALKLCFFAEEVVEQSLIDTLDVFLELAHTLFISQHPFLAKLPPSSSGVYTSQETPLGLHDAFHRNSHTRRAPVRAKTALRCCNS